MNNKPPHVAAVAGYVDDFGAICDRARVKVVATVMDHFKRNPNYALVGEPLLRLERSIKAAYGQWDEELKEEFKKALPDVCQEFFKAAEKDLRKNGVYQAIMGKPDMERIKEFLESDYTQVALRTDKMQLDHINKLRQLSADVFRRASLTGTPIEEVSRELLGKALETADFAFIDISGRVWKSDAYFEMLARTELMRAGNETYADKCVADGYDVMQLSYSGNPCKYCAPYQGRLFSLTGATKGLPTLADLKAAKVFHPNCTHSYSAVPDYIIQTQFNEDGTPKRNGPPAKEQMNLPLKDAMAKTLSPRPGATADGSIYVTEDGSPFPDSKAYKQFKPAYDAAKAGPINFKEFAASQNIEYAACYDEAGKLYSVGAGNVGGVSIPICKGGSHIHNHVTNSALSIWDIETFEVGKLKNMSVVMPNYEFQLTNTQTDGILNVKKIKLALLTFESKSKTSPQNVADFVKMFSEACDGTGIKYTCHRR